MQLKTKATALAIGSRGLPGWFAGALLALGACEAAAQPPSAAGAPGLVDGTTTWEVPATPNGLQPNNSWFSIASAADGNIYLGACDHISNSALYRITPEKDDRLGFLGDAVTASEAADNVLPGETFEKFHVRPLWFRGRVYVATADYSNQDGLHVEKDRGFHWYSYNSKKEKFTDVSAGEPNGVGAEHISIFATVLDEERGVIYGIGSPTSNLYKFDTKTGVTTDLGRSPLLTRPYYNPGRYLWVDSRGRVYFTVGSAGVVAPGEIGAPKHVMSWDPTEGWGAEPTWKVSEMLRTGQCTADRERCYILDYKLNLYRFDDAARTLTKINSGVLDAAHYSQRVKGTRVRSMNLSANEKKIYFVNDSADVMSLYEWDFAATSTPLELARMPDLDGRFDARYTAYTGHDSWDRQGRFYFTSFGGEGVPATPNMYVMRVDPVRVKAALGVLPGVAKVELHGKGKHRSLVRVGDTTNELQVILRLELGDHTTSIRTVTVPAGETVVPVELLGPQKIDHVSVIPDGDTYVVHD